MVKLKLLATDRLRRQARKRPGAGAWITCWTDGASIIRVASRDRDKITGATCDPRHGVDIDATPAPGLRHPPGRGGPVTAAAFQDHRVERHLGEVYDAGGFSRGGADHTPAEAQLRHTRRMAGVRPAGPAIPGAAQPSSPPPWASTTAALVMLGSAIDSPHLRPDTDIFARLADQRRSGQSPHCEQPDMLPACT